MGQQAMGNSDRLLSGVVGSGTLLLLLATPATAQILPDATLPQNSIVMPNATGWQIDGGTTAGSNLFHSFSEFSIPSNREAFFNNAASIENIITRVTGGKLSTIDGLIRANGTANLFFLNPNGIAFGPNARLDIGGSFIGTTAESLLFENGSFYSATEQNSPPLLTINVPMGLQVGGNSTAIEVRGTGITDIVPAGNLGLTVAPGQTLALVGSGVTFTGGMAIAPSGRLEVGSVRNGEVGLVKTPAGFQLKYDLVSEFGNLQLSNRSSLFSPAVINTPHSEINLAGRTIVLDGSQIVSLTNNHANSGNISVRASESLELGGTISTVPFSAWIVNQVTPGATGNSGRIDVGAPQVSINDGARIQSLSFGAGAAGDVTVDASESIRIAGFALPPDLAIDFSNIDNIDSGQLLEQSPHSRISSENLAAGMGGDVRVSAGEIAFLAGGQISTLAGRQGLGNGGNAIVNADTITGENTLPFNPLVFSGIGSYTLGNADGGNVELSAREVTLLDGAEIFSLTGGSGKGGDITARIANSLAAVELNSQLPVLPSGIGSFTFGSGDAGNIETSVRNLDLSSGGRLISMVFIQVFGMPVPNAGTGNAGDVAVRADTINLAGTSALNSAIISQLGTSSFGLGDGGDVDVSARQIRIADGAALAAGTAVSFTRLGKPLPSAGTGNAGNVTVNASESISVSGVNPFNNQNSLLLTGSGGIGNAGRIVVRAPRISLRAGGLLGSTVFATGNSGQLTVDAGEITIDGTAPGGIPSQIAANASVFPEAFQEAFFLPALPSGNTGRVVVNADRIAVSNGGSINVQHLGTGNAGELQINVDRLDLDSGGNINATTASGFGGNVEINVGDSLQLRNDSQINVEARSDRGDGGNLTINADTVVALENSDIIANAVGGNGGNINITTPGLFQSVDSDITASSQFGISGTITINNPETNQTAVLVELPETIDASQQIVEACAADLGNTFTITGRGGLPPNPTQLLRSRALWYDERTLSAVSHKNEQRLVEATNWIEYPNGQIELVANNQTPRDILKAARNLSRLSLDALKAGKLFKAAGETERGKQLLQQVSNSPEALRIRGTLLNTEGNIKLAMGKTRAALETWQKAARNYQLAKDERGRLGAIVNQAQALQNLGLYRRAATLLESANKQLKTATDPLMKATALRSWGAVLQAVGELEKSTEILQQSLAISQRLKADSSTSATLLSLGNVAIAKGETEAAIQFYSQAAATATRPQEKTEAFLNRLAIYVRTKQEDAARNLSPKIEVEIQKIPTSRQAVYARINWADSRRKLAADGKKLADLEIVKLLEVAVKEAQELSDERGEAIALQQLALLYREMGELITAQRVLEKSLLLAEGLGAEEIGARSQAQLGNILKQQGKTEEAIAAYSNAVKGFESLRRDLVAISEDVRFKFRETVEPTYRELVSLLLQDRPSQSQLKQAIEAIEALQLTELDNFFRDACLEAKPQPIDQIDRTAAVIYPILLPDSLNVVLLQPNRSLTHHKVKITRSDVLSVIREMRRDILRKIPITSDWIERSRKLHGWLIKPFEEQLKEREVETLVFVLDSELRNLPIAAIYDGEQYLVEKYAIALTPGLQFLKQPALQPEKLQALTAGISESVQGFRPLPAVESELDRIAAKLPAEKLLNQEFTSDNLENQIEETPFPIVHIATHGQFSSNREETFILAWNEKINVTEFEQLLRTRSPRESTSIELLILSACQTAIGDERAALGLAGIAVRSGARSTLATLWSVQDDSTAEFMVEFYRQLTKPNISKAEALRRAQIALLQGEYKQPYFWAPFVLVGNWL